MSKRQINIKFKNKSYELTNNKNLQNLGEIDRFFTREINENYKI